MEFNWQNYAGETFEYFSFFVLTITANILCHLLLMKEKQFVPVTLKSLNFCTINGTAVRISLKLNLGFWKEMNMKIGIVHSMELGETFWTKNRLLPFSQRVHNDGFWRACFHVTKTSTSTFSHNKFGLEISSHCFQL